MANYKTASLIAVVLALMVIMHGAYTRLSDAGLGCPDWPGCYGKLVMPRSPQDIKKAQTAFPHNPIVSAKAWTEMTHRYLAGTLGLLILALAVWALMRKRKIHTQRVWVPWLLVALVGVQAALGMWTVTLKLLPLVVMSHLLGGMTIAALLWWMSLSNRDIMQPPAYKVSTLKPWAVGAIIIVALQIFLGGWTSTHYAGLACPTFPFCHGSLFPPLHLKTAFNVFSPVGPNYNGGHLAMDARVTIQMVHRYGALITTAYLLPFSLALMMVNEFKTLRPLGVMILSILCIQFTLGVLNIVHQLPLWVAVAHNGVAALMLLTLVTVIYKLFAQHHGEFTRV